MPFFHLTATLGRSDTLTVESPSKSKILNFFANVSEAVVRNIKEIMMSKDLNINYIPSLYVEGAVYSRVVVQAMSENFSETYVLYNVRKSVKEEDIIREFKKLLINNEPITDFITIQFYNEGGSPKSIDNLYQVQYKRNSKTYVEDFYCSSWQSARELVEALIDGEITEIRKYVYFDGTVKKDTGDNYYKGVAVSFQNESSYRAFRIPKVKHSIAHNVLLEQISTTFQINNLYPKKDDIKTTYR